MKKLFKAVLIITCFTAVDRILGFGFKIFLARNLGEVNFGIYQVALSIFFVLLTFTTSGIPLIVSKITAISRKKGDAKAESATVTAALICSVILSIVICGLVLLIRNPIAGIFATRESMYLLLLMLPAVLFSGIYAAFRGNMWGRQRYVTVSVIELIEQITRISIVVILALLGFNILRITAISLSIAMCLTAILCIACYFKRKGRLTNPKTYIKPLIKQAAPVTMIRASNTLVAGLISIVVPRLLQRTGLSVAESMAMFGSSVGMALPLIFLPITVVGSLSYVLIPSLSAAHASGDKQTVKTQVEGAISFSLVVAALFIPVFFALGQPLGLLVYNTPTPGRFIALSAFLLVPLAAESIVSSMMNALDLERQSFVNYLIGAAIMFGLMYATGRHFRIEFLLLGMGIAWTFSTFLDVIAIKKRTKIKLSSFLMPLLKCLVLVVPTVFVTRGLYFLMGNLPLAARVIVPAVISLVFITLLSLVFNVIDLSVFFSGKPRKNRFNIFAKFRMKKKRRNFAKRPKNKKPVV